MFTMAFTTATAAGLHPIMGLQTAEWMIVEKGDD
jgi:hypothetical protein